MAIKKKAAEMPKADSNEQHVKHQPCPAAEITDMQTESTDIQRAINISRSVCAVLLEIPVTSLGIRVSMGPALTIEICEAGTTLIRPQGQLRDSRGITDQVVFNMVSEEYVEMAGFLLGVAGALPHLPRAGGNF